MGLFKKIFGGADGIRETMLESYQKHRRLAGSGTAGDTSPHEAGLYGALASRYLARRAPRSEPQVWIELVPFLLMEESTAPRVLAELAVYAEMPSAARLDWLRKQVNGAFSNLQAAPDHIRVMARMAEALTPPWWTFLNEPARSLIQKHGLAPGEGT